MQKYYLAIDIGASSGRHILGSVINKKIYLEEVYRFENSMEEIEGTYCWNTEKIFNHILEGMKKCKEIGKIPVSVGIDTWGVDFVLLDKQEKRLGEAVGYRDQRTKEMPSLLSKIISEQEIYQRTGIQRQVYNTLYQLMSLQESVYRATSDNNLLSYQKKANLLEQAESLLFTPDYYHFLLSGVKCQEYTIASTSMLLNAHTNTWDYELIEQLELPRHLFKELTLPGTVIGELLPKIREEVGYNSLVVAPAAHDTASAVAAIPSTEKDVLYISSGTWSLMGIEAEEPNCSEACRRAGFTNEGGYNHRHRILKNIMGLWMIQSVRKEIAKELSYAEICTGAEKETITSIVDCNDESFLAPASMVQAVQEFCQRSNQQIPEGIYELAAVIYNSLAKCYASSLNEIELLTGKQYNIIHIIGGGSNATYLNELTAKYTGREVAAGPGEATAIGNLIVQMIAAKEFTTLEEGRKCI